MSSNIFVDKQKAPVTAGEVPAFPWVRIDANKFIWVEAFIDGNYLTLRHSEMGRGLFRERLYNKYLKLPVVKKHLFAFELEVDGQLLRDNWKWEADNTRKTPQGFDELVISLLYEQFDIRVNVHTLLDGSSFITRWLEIENYGSKPRALSRVFPWCGLIAADEMDTSIATTEDNVLMIPLQKPPHNKVE